jgi:hypothetical protein
MSHTDTCSVCLETIGENKEATTLGCSHSFHKECVDNWIETKGTCPNCRYVEKEIPSNENPLVPELLLHMMAVEISLMLQMDVVIIARPPVSQLSTPELTPHEQQIAEAVNEHMQRRAITNNRSSGIEKRRNP